MFDEEQILTRFRYHPATPVTGPKHDRTRDVFLSMARYILAEIPPGRHQSLALTALQESLMWSNVAIACDTEDARYE